MSDAHDPYGDRSTRDEQQRTAREESRGFDRDQAERQAREAIGNARDELQSLLENQKNAAANQVRAVADALRDTAHTLDENGQRSVAAYVGHVADRIDYWSGRLRERHIEQLGRDIQQLASHQPALFVAGALIVGFVATRFLRSSSSDDSRRPASSASDQRPPQSSTASEASVDAHIKTDPTRADASESRSASDADQSPRPDTSVKTSSKTIDH